jgi:alpha-methylacyl-CoA racemase
MTGPLSGLRVVELVGQGPGPYCGMLLADLGADVVAVDRPSVANKIDPTRPARNTFMRGKRGVALDLKDPSDVETMLKLLDVADVFIDPFRPGVCERLGIGPDVVSERNPGIIYGRMTGWGQEGPLAQVAGHDINYIAMSGALSMIGYEGQPPTFPINLLGDFAGGGLMLALGIASAAFERSVSGRGQVIDAAMIDGSAAILGPFVASGSGGGWGPRGTNHLDGAAPFYNVYETSDGEWIAIGAIEPQFHAELYRLLELAAPVQWDKPAWSAEKERLAGVFITRPRADWCALLEGTEACFSPVLSPVEAAAHPHAQLRGTFVENADSLHAQAAPRFSRTPAAAGVPAHPGSSTCEAVRAGWS